MKIFALLFSRYIVVVYWGGRIIKHRSWTQQDAAEWAAAYADVDAAPFVRRRY